jgi:hypothetical protein
LNAVKHLTHDLFWTVKASFPAKQNHSNQTEVFELDYFAAMIFDYCATNQDNILQVNPGLAKGLVQLLDFKGDVEVRFESM